MGRSHGGGPCSALPLVTVAVSRAPPLGAVWLLLLWQAARVGALGVGASPWPGWLPDLPHTVAPARSLAVPRPGSAGCVPQIEGVWPTGGWGWVPVCLAAWPMVSGTGVGLLVGR